MGYLYLSTADPTQANRMGQPNPRTTLKRRMDSPGELPKTVRIEGRRYGPLLQLCTTITVILRGCMAADASATGPTHRDRRNCGVSLGQRSL